MKKRMIAIGMAVLMLLNMVSLSLAEEDFSPEEDASVYDAYESYETGSDADQGQTLEDLLGIDYSAYPKTMYVYTDNGGTLNVRSEPIKRANNVLGVLNYGAAVVVLGPVVINADWTTIQYPAGPDGVGYVMTRYLTGSKPKAKAKKTASATNPPKPARTRTDDMADRKLAELNRQLASAKVLDRPLMGVVRTTRSSGWINFRVGPGIASENIGPLPDGRELKIIGETNSWYQAVDTVTGKTGYISKDYVTVLGVQPEPEQPEKPAKEQMGKLNVNGEFSLQCRLPEGYTMQLINTLGTKINAFITSEDVEKPILQLSIAYNELYSDIKRMNDLPAEELALLEASFTEQNDVDISYSETAYGTRLMIVKEVGTDTDFVDIFSIYEGYSIEFVMSPNPYAKNAGLTDQQIQMCIDFLSELDFVPAAKTITFQQ